MEGKTTDEMYRTRHLSSWVFPGYPQDFYLSSCRFHLLFGSLAFWVSFRVKSLPIFFPVHLLVVELTSPHNLCSDAVLCLWLPMSAAGEIVPWAVPHPSTTGLSYLFMNYLWISPSRGLGGPSAWLPVHTSGRNSPSAGLSVLDLESLPLLPKI